MLAELLEQDHRQQARPGPAAGDHMERRRRLADLLAVAAGELLADVLDHLPGRDHLQRLGDVLAQLGQPRAAAAGAGRWARLDHPLARQMLGKGLARRPLAGEGRHVRGLGRGDLGGDFVLGGRGLQFLQLQLHLVQQPDRALRARAIELALELLDLQLQMRDQGLVVGLLSPDSSRPRRERRSAPPSAFRYRPAGLHDRVDDADQIMKSAI